MHNVRGLLGCGAFLALPLLGLAAAAAVRSVSCEIDAADVNESLHGFKTGTNVKFAVECQGEGIVVAGEATTTSNKMTLQVRLRTLTGTSATGTTQAIGYGSNRQP